MPEPLDLAALQKRCAYRSEVSGELEPEFDSREMLRCLAVIEALAAALEASLAVAQVDDEGLMTAEWNRAYHDAKAALALVMGGT